MDVVDMVKMGEFELIERYFRRGGLPPPSGMDVGIGDDCALRTPSPGMQWAISSDMLVEGRHFLADTNPYKLGHKALAVNLSDLAACGARPVCFTLALALPRIDPDWLAAFSQGLLALADAHGCPLVGGDTTQGPLTIAITVMGEVPPGQALLRSGAQVGDGIYLSGTVGDAGLVLAVLQGRCTLAPEVLARLRPRLEAPTPRVALGQALRGVATAAIDLSDGLAGDLGHVLKASGLGACIDTSFVFNSPATSPEVKALPPHQAFTFCLGGGDDYELLFTAPPSRHAQVLAAAQACQMTVTRIGSTRAQTGLVWTDAQGHCLKADWGSFEHFKAS